MLLFCVEKFFCFFFIFLNECSLFCFVVFLFLFIFLNECSLAVFFFVFFFLFIENGLRIIYKINFCMHVP